MFMHLIRLFESLSRFLSQKLRCVLVKGQNHKKATELHHKWFRSFLYHFMGDHMAQLPITTEQTIDLKNKNKAKPALTKTVEIISISETASELASIFSQPSVGLKCPVTCMVMPYVKKYI